jgi:beta-mannanase
VSGIAATAEQGQVASISGESPSIVLGYKDFTQAAPITELETAYNNGRLPLLTWEPWVAGSGVVQPAYALRNITNGNFDTYIQQWALDLKGYGKPLMLRFAHEMNGNWYPWSEQVNGNAAGDYVDAWRHVRDIFAATGVTNVQWVWSPNTPYFGAVDLSSVYPGDSYVDIVALDGYNWGTTQTWGSAWQSPEQMFDAGLSALRSIAPGKDIIISETASAEQGGSKADWNTALISYLNAQPDVTAFVLFNLNKEVDWRIDSSPSSASAFAAALASRR